MRADLPAVVRVVAVVEKAALVDPASYIIYPMGFIYTLQLNYILPFFLQILFGSYFEELTRLLFHNHLDIKFQPVKDNNPLHKYN